MSAQINKSDMKEKKLQPITETQGRLYENNIDSYMSTDYIT